MNPPQLLKMGSNRTHLSLVFAFVCLSSLFHFLQCFAGVGYPLPSICTKQECAPYQVIHTQNEFEIRSYNSSTWISSPIITSTTYKSAVRDGFITLFNYIRGNNTRKAEWDMTAPVLVDILPKSSFEVYFYVPQKFQNNVPAPYESQHIQSVKLPKKKFAAVRRFTGYLDDATIAEEVAALKKSLQGTASASASAASSLDYSAADFNPPWKVKGRVNEIILWFN